MNEFRPAIRAARDLPLSDISEATLETRSVDHFAAIGGVPLLAVSDRAKTVALKWDRRGQVTEAAARSA